MARQTFDVVKGKEPMTRNATLAEPERPKMKRKEQPPDMATIEVPLGELVEGYIPEHVEARLDNTQGMAMQRLRTGLDESGLRLRNGRRVISNADVVRYLLENVA